MEYFIAPVFFQNKTCRLPGIGTLSIVTRPAETDFVNARIKAPQQQIIFTEDHLDQSVFNEFSALSELLKKDLDEKRVIELKGLGTFTKNDAGNIHFSAFPVSPAFAVSVNATRVVRQDAQHSILVGDKETTNTVMSEFYTEKETIKDWWWIWAISLALIGFGVLAVYFYLNGNLNFGNTHLIESLRSN